jgi:hypothetical protein
MKLLIFLLFLLVCKAEYWGYFEKPENGQDVTINRPITVKFVVINLEKVSRIRISIAGSPYYERSATEFVQFDVYPIPDKPKTNIMTLKAEDVSPGSKNEPIAISVNIKSSRETAQDSNAVILELNVKNLWSTYWN